MTESSEPNVTYSSSKVPRQTRRRSAQEGQQSDRGPLYAKRRRGSTAGNHTAHHSSRAVAVHHVKRSLDKQRLVHVCREFEGGRDHVSGAVVTRVPSVAKNVSIWLVASHHKDPAPGHQRRRTLSRLT